MQEHNKNNKSSYCLTILIDLIPDSVGITDSSGKIVSANKIIGKYTGFTKVSQGKTLDLTIFHDVTDEDKIQKQTLPIEPKFEVGGENTWIKIPESSSSTMMKQ